MRQTPLHDEHVALGGKVVDFHGWALPLQFSGILQEHLHTRTKASLFDCSHMGEFSVCGQDSLEAFDRLVCTDVAGIKVGRCRYGAMLNSDGGIVDDLITFRMADDELFVVVNAGPLALTWEVVRKHVARAEDLSDRMAKVDLQGPLAREVINGVFPEAADLKYFQACRVHFKGAQAIVSRTGYTGELGYEIFVPAECAVELWRTLLAHPDVEPAGLGARDTLRLEVGYPLSGQDFDETRTPLEAGLESFVAWDTQFTGREALERQRAEGVPAQLAALETPDRRALRHGFEVVAGQTVVGTVTSGTYGPTVGRGVGLAYLTPETAAVGTELAAGPKGLPVRVVELPFYKAGTCRT